MNLTPTVTLDVPDNLWLDEEGRLRVVLLVNGYSMHLEAWPIFYDDDIEQIQHLADNDGIDQPLDDLAAAVNADGSFNTTRIRGREYILVATPFC
jgi:hypothetical protein